MKFIVVLILSISFLSSAKVPTNCKSIVKELKLYDRISKEKGYSGDFDDVIDKLNEELRKCIEEDYAYISPFRSPSQQTQKEGYLF